MYQVFKLFESHSTIKNISAVLPQISENDSRYINCNFIKKLSTCLFHDNDEYDLYNKIMSGENSLSESELYITLSSIFPRFVLNS